MTYQPSDVGGDLEFEEFRLYVMEELKKVSIEVGKLPPVLTAVPKAPKDGLIVIADGTQWNPGSGAGYYGYHNGEWVVLGTVAIKAPTALAATLIVLAAPTNLAGSVVA